jgi:hypothetical protein
MFQATTTVVTPTRFAEGLTYSGFLRATFANLPDAERQLFLRAVIAKIQPLSDQWREDAIKEIRQLLSSALKTKNAG